MSGFQLVHFQRNPQVEVSPIHQADWSKAEIYVNKWPGWVSLSSTQIRNTFAPARRRLRRGCPFFRPTRACSSLDQLFCLPGKHLAASFESSRLPEALHPIGLPHCKELGFLNSCGHLGIRRVTSTLLLRALMDCLACQAFKSFKEDRPFQHLMAFGPGCDAQVMAGNQQDNVASYVG